MWGKALRFLPWAVGLWVASTLRRAYPRGKGVFLDDLVREGKNPAHLIERLKWLGCKWVAVEIYWVDANQENTHNLEDGALAAFVPELVRAGIKVWVWGFPAPWRVNRFVELTEHAYRVAPQVSGVIIDPEKPFYKNEFLPELEDLVSRLKDLGKPVGATSYGAPGYHPGFPWAGLSEADFGMPQVYSELGPKYPARADAEWRGLGIDKVIPLNGASASHTADAMLQQATWSKTGDGGIGWWSYRHLVRAKDSKRADRARMVRDFQV